jgi:hypothetical protein
MRTTAVAFAAAVFFWQRLQARKVSQLITFLLPNFVLSTNRCTFRADFSLFIASFALLSENFGLIFKSFKPNF